MLINRNLIVLDLDAKCKTEVIKKMIDLAYKEDRIISKEDFLKCVLEREEEISTGVGNSIAIPHGKSETVKEALIVFAKLKNGIDWESMDSEKVDLIFLLGVPERNKENLHLKILAQLSRKLMDEDFVKLLRNAATGDEVYYILSSIEAS
jgi:PTS system fructose-specific IIA component